MRTGQFLCAMLVTASLFLPAPPARAEEETLSATPVLRIETGTHTARIFKMDSDRDNRFLVTGSEDKTVRVWELPSVRLLKVLRPPIGSENVGFIRAVAISPDGSSVACGGITKGQKGYNIYIFDRESSRMTSVISGLPDFIHHLAYSKDGKFLVAALQGANGIRVYNTKDLAPVPVFDDRYEGAALCVDLDAAGRMVTVSFDGSVRLYDSSFRLIGKKNAPGGKLPLSVKFSPDGSKVAVSFYDSPKVDVLSGKDLSPLYGQALAGKIVPSVAWSSDGKHLYAANIGEKGPFILGRWGDEGRGPFRELKAEKGDTRAGRSVKTALFALRGGYVAFANQEPAIGIVNEAGDIVSYKDTTTLWFMNDDDFLISRDGMVVRFNVFENRKKTLRFSLADRRMDEVTGAGGPAVELFHPDPDIPGMRITDWRFSPTPKLNGRLIKIRKGEFSMSRAVSADGKYFAIGTNFSMYLFDGSGTQVWRTFFPHVRYVNIARNGRVVVAATSDGTIRWHSITDGKVLLTLFPSGDMKRWVAWSPSGYYDAAPGAEELIGWHINRGEKLAADFFPVSRFRSVYYRPDVVAKTLETKDDKTALLAADRESGRKTEEVAIQKILPPVVSIVYPKDGTEIKDVEITIKFTVRSPSGDPVTGIKVLIDGRPVQTPRGLDAPGEELRQMNLRMPEKDSRISVLAMNRNATSEPSTINLRWAGNTMTAKKPPEMVVPKQGRPGREEVKTPVKKAETVKAAPEKKAIGAARTDEFVIKPKLYILAVGVSNYNDKELKLGFAAKDADDFSRTMARQKGELYRDIIVRLVVDEKATKDNILDGLDWITKETTSKDVAMVFLAGHGMNDPNGIYYFLPVNTDLDKLKRTGLAFSDIKNTVVSLAGKTILFVDTCHSGNIMGSRRGVADINALVNELSSAENGAVVFSSSSGRQFSVEDASWGNGAFTKALVEGLSGKADFLGKGRITINMLDLYLSERVKELTMGKQTPTTAKPTTVPDFPIAVMKQ